MADKIGSLKGIIVAYMKIKYINIVTSNNGEINLSICENC